MRALAGGLAGLVKTVALEATTLFCRALDITPDLPADAVADAFAAEVADIATDVREVGIDTEGRRTPCLSAVPRPVLPAPRPHAGLTTDDLLLVTGGGRGITAWCAEALSRTHPCGYLLLGPTPLDEEPSWAAGLDTVEALRAACEETAREAGEDSPEAPLHALAEQEAEHPLAAARHPRPARRAARPWRTGHVRG
ncbi:hypothetical protein GTY73_15465, partial [Streptomyces sp. SID8354]|nr:hypothetical protein [Streptomyces sp. SID8354]